MTSLLFKLSLVSLLVSGTVLAVNYGVYHENDLAKVIFTHVPSNELVYSSLHPKGNLYSNSMSIEATRRQHESMRNALKILNATVYTLRDVLLNNTHSSDGKALKELRNFASKYLQYDTSHLNQEYRSLKKLFSNYSEDRQNHLNQQLIEIKPQISRGYQEKYRQEVLNSLSPETLVDIILTRPTVELHLRHWTIDDKDYVNLESKTNVKPLGNLYFLRDQQMTTQKGIVMLRSHLRSGEAEVTEFVWKKFGIPVVCKLARGFAEGGEYIPYGNLAFIGQGVRTSMEAVEELMENDCFGAEEVAVVRDYSDHSNDRMHLDTFFNILDGKGNVILLEDILTKHKRYVDLFLKKVDHQKEKSSDSNRFGRYVRIGHKMEFGHFLQIRGFNVTTVTNEEQLKFALNFLNVGNSTLIVPYGEASYLQRLRKLGIKPHFVDLDHLLAGNGGIHCMTQVVYRQRL